jgi:lipoprotein signal peptidase
MKKGKKKSVIMAMICAIIGLIFSIVFSNSSNMLIIIPVAGVAGGLIGAMIDGKWNKDLP